MDVLHFSRGDLYGDRLASMGVAAWRGKSEMRPQFRYMRVRLVLFVDQIGIKSPFCTARNTLIVLLWISKRRTYSSKCI